MALGIVFYLNHHLWKTCQLTASTICNLKFDEIFYLITGEELALGDDDEEDDDEDDIFNNSTSGKNNVY